MKKLFFHIGYPKTGSTFLQKYYYPKFFFNLGKPYGNPLTEYNKLVDVILKNIFHLSDKDFELQKKVLQDLAKKLINFNDTSKHNIISLEDFTSLNNTLYFNLRNIFRIKYIFDINNVDLKIIIFIRKQEKIITSNFLWSISHLKKIDSKYLKFRNFAYAIINQDPKIENYLKNLDYYNLYENMIKVYEENQIKIFIFEEMQKNNLKFFHNFSEKLNLNVKEDEILKLILQKEKYFSKSPIWVLKIFVYRNFVNVIFNHKKYFKNLKIFNKLCTLISFLKIIIFSKFNNSYQIFLDSYQENKIRNIYKKNNIKLSDKLKLDLEKHGY